MRTYAGVLQLHVPQHDSAAVVGGEDDGAAVVVDERDDVVAVERDAAVAPDAGICWPCSSACTSGDLALHSS